jgi:hypothetical protein
MKRLGYGLVAVILFATTVAGCATASRQSWTKEGAGPDDLARDRSACIQESRVPYPTPYGASVASGGSDSGFFFTDTARQAQSEANHLFDACMEGRGWR